MAWTAQAQVQALALALVRVLALALALVRVRVLVPAKVRVPALVPMASWNCQAPGLPHARGVSAYPRAA